MVQLEGTKDGAAAQTTTVKHKYMDSNYKQRCQSSGFEQNGLFLHRWEILEGRPEGGDRVGGGKQEKFGERVLVSYKSSGFIGIDT